MASVRGVHLRRTAGATLGQLNWFDLSTAWAEDGKWERWHEPHAHAMQRHTSERVCPAQRGFLQGRSMSLNIVDMEEAARTASLTEGHAMGIFFDIWAAYASVSRCFLMQLMARLGLPLAALHFEAALYDDDKRSSCVAGQQLDGFTMTAELHDDDQEEDDQASVGTVAIAQAELPAS